MNMQIPHKIIYRYRLNKNSKFDTITLEGVSLGKESWRCRNFKVTALDRHIRTRSNPEGMVDYERYERGTGKVIESNLYVETDFKDIQTYDPAELQYMDREEIVKIANQHGIPTIHQRSNFLIKKILEAQGKIEMARESVED